MTWRDAWVLLCGLLADDRRQWYREQYLFSDHWRTFASWRREQAGWRCQRCGSADWPLDVHHLAYWIIWAEGWFPWLTRVLCRRCHDAEHETGETE